VNVHQPVKRRFGGLGKRRVIAMVGIVDEMIETISLVMHLDPAVIAELSLQIKAAPGADGAAVRYAPTDTEVSDVALRLMRLLDRPESVPVLHRPARARAALLAADRPPRRCDPPARLTGQPRAADDARCDDPAAGIRTAAAGGTPGGSSRHERLLVPRAFPQRHLTVAAAIPEAASADRGTAADDVGRRHGEQRRLRVGYQSVPQFTREYGRMFGAPPARDAEANRSWAESAA
jgi:hypothetical protein